MSPHDTIPRHPRETLKVSPMTHPRHFHEPSEAPMTHSWHFHFTPKAPISFPRPLKVLFDSKAPPWHSKDAPKKPYAASKAHLWHPQDTSKAPPWYLITLPWHQAREIHFKKAGSKLHEAIASSFILGGVRRRRTRLTKPCQVQTAQEQLFLTCYKRLGSTTTANITITTKVPSDKNPFSRLLIHLLLKVLARTFDTIAIITITLPAAKWLHSKTFSLC